MLNKLSPLFAMIGDCSEKSAIIIGATSDIGEEMISRLMKYNISNLIITGRDSNHLEKIAQKYQGKSTKIHKIEVDLSKEKNILEFEQKYKPFSDIKIDYYLFCPGTCGAMDQVSYLQMKYDISKVININFLSAVTTFEAISPSSHCSAVFVSSTNSFHPLECGTGYCTTKAALSEYSKLKAKELLNSGVRVNSIAPGLIATKFHDNYFESKEELTAFFQEHVKTTVLGRLVSIDGVANTIEFLFSDLSKDVTGTQFVIDCGETLFPDNEDDDEEESSTQDD